MVDRDFTDDLDDDMEEGDGARLDDHDGPVEDLHPANPATVPQAPPATITVEIGRDERLNLAVRMVHLMEEQKEEKKKASKHAKRAKELQDEIDGMANAIRTGTKEVPNGEQQNLLDGPVGGQAAAETFGDLAKKAEAAKDAAEAPAPQAPEWQPHQHKDHCPNKLNPLAGCVPSCGWNKGMGVGPVAEEEPFEAPEAELEKQSGRKKTQGKKAA